MADSIQDLLHNKNFDKPDEVEQLKSYVLNTYNDNCSVSVSKNTLVIAVGNSSLAATLRMNILDIKNKYNIKQKIIIRTV